MIITTSQRQFLLILASEIVPMLKRNKKLRNELRNAYSRYAMSGHAIDGIRHVIENICGWCDFPDETLKPFIKAIVIHLQADKPARERLTKEKQEELLIACGMKCQECGKLLTNVNFDHILPYCLVYETLDDNRQCLCPECNRAKAATIRVRDLSYA